MPLHPDLQPGEVVLLQVDFGDDSEIKLRPALVITQNAIHQNSKGFVFLGITTKPLGKFMTSITNVNLERGTIEPGNVIYDKPIWTEQTYIQKKIGKVKKDYFENIMALLKKNVLS